MAGTRGKLLEEPSTSGVCVRGIATLPGFDGFLTAAAAVITVLGSKSRDGSASARISVSGG
jgi:hypothetical protein